MASDEAVNVIATAMHMQRQEEEEEARKKAQELSTQPSISNMVQIGGNSSDMENVPPSPSLSPSIPANRPKSTSSLKNARDLSTTNNGSSVPLRTTESQQTPFSWGDEGDDAYDSISAKKRRESRGFFGSLPFVIRQLIKILFFASPALIAILVVLLLFKPKPTEIYSLLERQEGPLNWKMELCRYSLYYIITIALYFASPVIFVLLIYLLKIIPSSLPGGLGKRVAAWLNYFLGTKSYWGFLVFTILFHILTVNLLVDNNRPLWKDPATGNVFKENPHPLLQDYYTKVPSSSEAASTSTTPPSSALGPSFNGSEVFNGSHITNAVKTLTDGNVIILHKLTKCLMVFAIFLAIEKSFIQILAVRFHKSAFAGRIFDLKLNKSYFEDLYYISKVRGESGHHGGLSFKVFSPTTRGNYDVESGLDLKAIDLTATEKPPKKSPSSSTIQTVGFDDKSPEALEAISKARSIYLYLSSTPDFSESEGITESAFRPYFSKDIYKEVFGRFDLDGSGAISKTELKELALSLVKEEQDIKTSLRNHGQIVRKLDTILTSIAFCIALVISLSFFQYNVGMYLASIGTFMLGFTFVFGGFAKAIFEDLVFLFVTHPYDVGDEIMLNGEQSTVVNVDLLTTTFLRWDGQLVLVPTQSLISKDILNIKRSGAQAECFDISISSSTSVDKVATFKAKLQQQLKESKKDFTGKILMAGFDIDGDKMRLRLTVEHKTNFQSLETKSQRHNKIKMALREIAESEGITYYSL